GQGTYVSTRVGASRLVSSKSSPQVRLSAFGSAADAAWARMNFFQRVTPPPPYDFAYGSSDLETFPFEAWRRILLRSARKASTSKLRYGPARGNFDLREAICSHVRRGDTLVCEPRQVMVMHRSQQAIDL